MVRQWNALPPLPMFSLFFTHESFKFSAFPESSFTAMPANFLFQDDLCSDAHRCLIIVAQSIGRLCSVYWIIVLFIFRVPCLSTQPASFRLDATAQSYNVWQATREVNLQSVEYMPTNNIRVPNRYQILEDPDYGFWQRVTVPLILQIPEDRVGADGRWFKLPSLHRLWPKNRQSSSLHWLLATLHNIRAGTGSRSSSSNWTEQNSSNGRRTRCLSCDTRAGTTTTTTIFTSTAAATTSGRLSLNPSRSWRWRSNRYCRNVYTALSRQLQPVPHGRSELGRLGRLYIRYHTLGSDTYLPEKVRLQRRIARNIFCLDSSVPGVFFGFHVSLQNPRNLVTQTTLRGRHPKFPIFKFTRSTQKKVPPKPSLFNAVQPSSPPKSSIDSRTSDQWSDVFFECGGDRGNGREPNDRWFHAPFTTTRNKKLTSNSIFKKFCVHHHTRRECGSTPLSPGNSTA